MPTKQDSERESIIEIVYGSIVDDALIADVIVNSTRSDLDLNEGVISKSILTKAGDSIKDEIRLNYRNGIRSCDIAITSAGKLINKKHIFHCCLKNWDIKNPDLTKEHLKNIMCKIFEAAEEKNAKSIAFPALGTGRLKYPKDIVPKWMYDITNEYLEGKKTKPTFNSVKFVVYDGDTDTVKAFKEYESKIGKNKDNNNNTILKNFFKNLQKFDCECNVSISDIKLKAYVGDITESTTDLILNPTNSNLAIEGNVFKALTNKLAKNYYESLKPSISNFKIDGVLITEAGGSLKCKGIIHVDVVSNDISTALAKAFQRINDSKTHKSVTIPIIGTGAGTKDPKESVKSIINGICTYVTSMKKNSTKILIENIHICIYTGQANFINYFIDEFNSAVNQNQSDNYSISLINLLPKMISGINFIGSFLYQSNYSNKPKIENDLFEKEITSQEEFYDFLTKLDDNGKKNLQKLLHDESITIEWKSNNTIFLTGHHQNVTKSYSIIASFVIKQFINQYDIPKTWDITLKEHLIVLDPSANAAEYNYVRDLITNTGLPFNKIVSLQRIQNETLYVKYNAHKNAIDRSYPNKSNKLTLFHGTNSDCVENIWRKGFNRSYAGKNATAYGQGVYFAKTASYSHHYTDIKKGKKEGKMFIAKVIVGKYSLGNKDMKVPPNNSDTTVDNENNPSIYVIYDDAQAYPEFLLTYE